MNGGDAAGLALLLAALGGGAWWFARSRSSYEPQSGDTAPSAGNHTSGAGFSLLGLLEASGIGGHFAGAAGEDEGLPPGAATVDVDSEGVRYLAATIWGEARSEPRSGQEAVAEVVLNRLASGRWGGSIKAVVTAYRQFSPWEDHQAPDLRAIAAGERRPGDAVPLDVARAAMAGQLPRRLGLRFLHFYAPGGVDAEPSWAAGASERKVIGGHVFLEGVA